MLAGKLTTYRCLGLRYTLDKLRPGRKSWGRFLEKSGYSKQLNIQGHLESHMHAQGNIYAQKTTEKNISFTLG